MKHTNNKITTRKKLVLLIQDADFSIYLKRLTKLRAKPKSHKLSDKDYEYINRLWSSKNIKQKSKPKPKPKPPRKPVMSKRVKIHRLLRSCTDLTMKETEFLMQIYGMMNTGKEELVSGKQHSWVNDLLKKYGEKHGAKKLSRTGYNGLICIPW